MCCIIVFGEDYFEFISREIEIVFILIISFFGYLLRLSFDDGREEGFVFLILLILVFVLRWWISSDGDELEFCIVVGIYVSGVYDFWLVVVLIYV